VVINAIVAEDATALLGRREVLEPERGLNLASIDGRFAAHVTCPAAVVTEFVEEAVLAHAAHLGLVAPGFRIGKKGVFEKKKKGYAKSSEKRMGWTPVIRVPAFASEREFGALLLCLIDDGRCAQSEADLADDFITTPRSRDASAVDGRFVTPVSKLTKLPKPAPATGSSSSKKRRSASQKAGDSEPSDGDGDFKPKHNPFHGNNWKAAAIDDPNQLKRATKAHDAYRGLCATTYARFLAQRAAVPFCCALFLSNPARCRTGSERWPVLRRPRNIE
jgi:hypothetical protein